MIKGIAFVVVVWLIFMWLTTKETREFLYGLAAFYAVRAILVSVLVAVLVFFLIFLF